MDGRREGQRGCHLFGWRKVPIDLRWRASFGAVVRRGQRAGTHPSPLVPPVTTAHLPSRLNGELLPIISSRKDRSRERWSARRPASLGSCELRGCRANRADVSKKICRGRPRHHFVTRPVRARSIAHAPRAIHRTYTATGSLTYPPFTCLCLCAPEEAPVRPAFFAREGER